MKGSDKKGSNTCDISFCDGSIVVCVKNPRKKKEAKSIKRLQGRKKRACLNALRILTATYKRTEGIRSLARDQNEIQNMFELV